MADPCRLVPARQGGSDQLIAELAIGCDIFCWRDGATRPRARLAIELANSCCVGGIAGFLALLGIVGARTGGAEVLKPTIRVTFWGALAMAATAAIGAILGTVI